MAATEVALWAGRDALVEPLGPDRSRVALSAWSWDGVAARFAMFGVPLRVIGPPDLADAMRRLADRATAAITA